MLLCIASFILLENTRDAISAFFRKAWTPLDVKKAGKVSASCDILIDAKVKVYQHVVLAMPLAWTSGGQPCWTLVPFQTWRPTREFQCENARQWRLCTFSICPLTCRFLGFFGSWVDQHEKGGRSPRLGVAKMWWQWRQIKLSFFQLTLARTKKLGMAGVKGNHNGDGHGENICVTKMIESCSVVTPVQIKNMAYITNHLPIHKLLHWFHVWMCRYYS